MLYELKYYHSLHPVEILHFLQYLPPLRMWQAITFDFTVNFLCKWLSDHHKHGIIAVFNSTDKPYHSN